MNKNTPLVERIATDGFQRIKLTQLQKRVIRMAEHSKLWLYQCKNCDDQPFFMGGSRSNLESASECRWCGNTVKPHKHQVEYES